MSKSVTFDAGHEEIIHDVALDYYGKRLASASSDKTIRIFELSGSNIPPSQQSQSLVATLRGHDGPVWQVSWAHPKFGPILASASYDGRVIVWKEISQNTWTKIFEFPKADTSCNSISWAPHELGLVLACGRSDGSISVFSRRSDNSNEWDQSQFQAHKGSCNAVSWSPNVGSGVSGSVNKLEGGRFVSCGSDYKVRIWRFDTSVNQWTEAQLEDSNNNSNSSSQSSIRDVAWAPSMGLPTNTIAAANDDKQVIIWTEDNSNNGLWKKQKVLQFETPVWRVSWSVMGNILAVSQGAPENKVSLWKEALDGDWKPLSTTNDNN